MRPKGWGRRRVSLIEFGVATGAGLMNMAEIAREVTALTGMEIKIHGFDTGKGMPPARDYRDHPDMYAQGDFAMNVERLRAKLPPNVELHLGEIHETVDAFLQGLPPTELIGYVVIDVDYYYSAVDALRIFGGRPEQYLPLTLTYLDDIWCERHNSACGERLAVAEWNAIASSAAHRAASVPRTEPHFSASAVAWPGFLLPRPGSSAARRGAERRRTPGAGECVSLEVDRSVAVGAIEMEPRPRRFERAERFDELG